MSTPTPIKASDPGSARRRHRRFAIEGSVRLYSGSAMWTTALVDLSLSGVQVLCPEQWHGTPGNRYRLDLRLPGGVMIAMGVELARLLENRELGFNCVKIDLGSFAQLKRLIELNLGNHSAMQDELTSLAGMEASPR